MATDFGHTKGPWMAASAPSGVVGWPIVGPMGKSIASVSWMPKPPDVPDEAYKVFRRGCEANARLIAAAPDLLEALTGIEGILATAESNASGNPEWEAVSAKINAARAAIAKATGK